MAPEPRAQARARSGDPWRAREERSLLLRAGLWAIDRLRWPAALFGLDHALFRELLRVRIVLALRPARSSTSAWGMASVVLALLMTWFAGLGTGLTALLVEDAGVWIVLSQSALMALLAMLLFQHFAGILVDPTDIGVVAPHPVADRTLFAVRLAEVFAYLLVFTACFTLGSMPLGLFAKPPLAVLLVFPVLSLLSALTTIGLVALLFALCLRLVGPTQFQRVTLWAQILSGLLFFVGLQVPRMAHREQWALWLEQLRGLRCLWPPFQYAELFAYASGTAPALRLGPALASLLVPLVALFATFWLASRYFVAGLQGTLSAPAPRSGWERGLLGRCGARLRGEERAGFDFALALSRREPHFLRAVLPQLVMFQAMSLGMGFGMRRDIALFLPMSAGFLFLALPNVLLQSQGTSVPEARELFAAAPVASEAALLRGGVKALLLQWIGLPALALFAVQLYLTGPGALPRIALAFELTFAAVLVFVRLFQLGLPFTQAIRMGATGAKNLGIVVGMGFGMVVLGGIHALLSLHPLALGAGLAGFGALLVVLWRRLGGLRVAQDRRVNARGSQPLAE